MHLNNCRWIMMRTLTVFTRILIALSVALVLSAPSFSEEPNLGLLKKEVIRYHDSGLYQKELVQTIAVARQYIKTQAQANQKKTIKSKLALVLDIDETSLSNYQKMFKRDFVGSRKQIHEEIQAANSPAIKPMLSLYHDALNQGIKVFFVTGRTESERKATQINLVKAGYKEWSGLYLRPKNYSNQSIIPYKAKTRANIVKQGYTIIASIGDQYSDIIGGYVRKGFKLPNPFYYLP